MLEVSDNELECLPYGSFGKCIAFNLLDRVELSEGWLLNAVDEWDIYNALQETYDWVLGQYELPYHAEWLGRDTGVKVPDCLARDNYSHATHSIPDYTWEEVCAWLDELDSVPAGITEFDDVQNVFWRAVEDVLSGQNGGISLLLEIASMVWRVVERARAVSR